MSELQQFVALTLTPIALVASGVALGAVIVIGLFHAVVDTDTFGERG